MGKNLKRYVIRIVSSPKRITQEWVWGRDSISSRDLFEEGGLREEKRRLCRRHLHLRVLKVDVEIVNSKQDLFGCCVRVLNLDLGITGGERNGEEAAWMEKADSEMRRTCENDGQTLVTVGEQHTLINLVRRSVS